MRCACPFLSLDKKKGSSSARPYVSRLTRANGTIQRAQNLAHQFKPKRRFSRTKPCAPRQATTVQVMRAVPVRPHDPPVQPELENAHVQVPATRMGETVLVPVPPPDDEQVQAMAVRPPEHVAVDC